MTLIAGGFTATGQPRTHVLIMAAGDYPNAAWSAGRSDEDNIAATMICTALNIKPLTSSTRSARHMADWFLARFRNTQTPLGSVELVLSEPGGPANYLYPMDSQTVLANGDVVTHPKGSQITVGPASFAGIQQAMIDWKRRCEADVGNLAVFYFCGHGAEGSNQVLLPADFPSVAGGNLDWSQGVHLNGFFNQMGRCAASHQVYFLDCCRSAVPEEYSEIPLGSALLTAGLGATRKAKAQYVFAIPERLSTGGAVDGIGDFTDLLLHSLRGAGAEKTAAAWQVTGSKLRTGCEKVRETFHEEGLTGRPYPNIQLDPSPALPQNGDPVLHEFSNGDPPLIPICIRCNRAADGKHASDAALAADYLLGGGVQQPAFDRKRLPLYVHVFLTPGKHKIQVKFPQGIPWYPTEMDIDVWPPCNLVPMMVHHV